MIGYIQEETRILWQKRIAEWIKELADGGQAGWSELDMLQLVRSDDNARCAVLNSLHARFSG